MDDFHKCVNTYRTFSLLFHLLWMLLPTDGKTIHAEAGTTVYLHCINQSISTLKLLKWQMNEVNLFSFTPSKPSPHVFDEARNLSINLLTSESELFALVIKEAQKHHSGNYTCEATMETTIRKQNYELLITEPAGKWSKHMIAVAVAVPCVSLLTFIITLILMLTVCRHRAQNFIHSSHRDSNEQTEDIYENCLENRGYNRPARNKPRAH
ncbi:uncharacterized protein LOC117819776 [Xyrichtys novacula]|uniref:Uncharacterized protein LOC117819776 n=1 Tax=Xyrichtys novacula TaxID=13765 RepID=A0AAV1H5R4_XYRNO|nr:uncharacterized protein LOC117819776 [Xyrichtys novacula]